MVLLSEMRDCGRFFELILFLLGRVLLLWRSSVGGYSKSDFLSFLFFFFFSSA